MTTAEKIRVLPHRFVRFVEIKRDAEVEAPRSSGVKKFFAGLWADDNVFRPGWRDGSVAVKQPIRHQNGLLIVFFPKHLGIRICDAEYRVVIALGLPLIAALNGEKFIALGL